MILADSGALYGLIDRNDRHHQQLKEVFETASHRDRLVVSLPILTEVFYLAENRLGQAVSWKFGEEVRRGLFQILDVDLDLLGRAQRIERKYASLKMGFVDSTSLALCEFHKIKTVITRNHRDFGVFRIGRRGCLHLLPEWH